MPGRPALVRGSNLEEGGCTWLTHDRLDDSLERAAVGNCRGADRLHGRLAQMPTR